MKDGLAELGVGLNDESGLEAFYNLALAPWLRVSADLQWIDTGTPDKENAVIGALQRWSERRRERRLAVLGA